MERKHWLEVALVCVLFLILAAYTDYSGRSIQEHSILKRDKEGGKDQPVDLILDAGDLLQDYDYQVIVPASGITGEQEKEYLEQAKKEIDDSFYDSGQGPEHVTTAVHGEKTYVQGLVKTEWTFDPGDVVDVDGNLTTEEIPESGVAVQACARLRCGEAREEYLFTFMVYPPVLTEREQFLQDLARALTEEGEKRGTASFVLPQSINGIQLRWRQKKEHTVIKTLFFEIVVLILLRFVMLERKRAEEKKRKEQMQLDYSEVVSKLLILLGSGMSLKQSWNRISTQYADKRKKKHLYYRAVYEEMLTTNYEICDGESERAAYEKFGERTGLGSYQRLVRILIQNLQTGSRGLCELLDQEASEALEERKALAKKMGEEAGTKMLMPLLLMLGIVIAIIMVPAMLSFKV